MAVFSARDIKAWRVTQKMSAADLAERISCDTSTIYRYESGKLKPDPDVMYEICEALGDTDRWTTWMRTESPMSYGRVHPETSSLDLPGAIMSMFAEMSDVSKMQNETLRDGADGKIDDPELKEKLSREIMEMLQSAQRVAGILRR